MGFRNIQEKLENVHFKLGKKSNSSRLIFQTGELQKSSADSFYIRIIIERKIPKPSLNPILLKIRTPYITTYITGYNVNDIVEK